MYLVKPFFIKKIKIPIYIMDSLKKLIGVVCVILACFAEYWLVTKLLEPAATNPFGKTAEAISIARYTLIPVSIPVILGGLICFGWYALKGEYEGSHE